MMKTLTMGLALTAMSLAGCGSDSDGGAASGPQADAAAAALESAEESGVSLDEDCVNDLAAQLSDDDAEKIVDAGDGDADLSAEGEELTKQLVGCADEDALADLFIDTLSDSGQPVDEDCVREKLQDLDIAEVVTASGSGEPPEELVTALFDCFDLGG